MLLCQRARSESCTRQSGDERRSHDDSGSAAGMSDSSSGDGGAGFVGPMFTSCTSTLSSPVVTIPPVLPPVLTAPLVELVMPPVEAGGFDVGAWMALGDDGNDGSEMRPDVSRLRSPESRTSAYALTVNAYVTSSTSASAKLNIGTATKERYFVICSSLD